MTRWEDLARLIDDGAGWDANDREAFCRLLGATTADRDWDPRIRRAVGACDILWPRPINDRLPPSKSCSGPDRKGARACLLAVVEGESARLEALLADREVEQEGEAAAAMARTVCDMGTGFERFQRYRAGLRREEGKSIDRILKLQKARDRRAIQAPTPIRVREERDEAPPSAVKAPGRPEPEGPYRWWNDPANFPETTEQPRVPELDSRPTSDHAGMGVSFAVGDLGRFLRDEGVATGAASVLTGRPEAGHGPVDPEGGPGRPPRPSARPGETSSRIPTGSGEVGPDCLTSARLYVSRR